MFKELARAITILAQCTREPDAQIKKLNYHLLQIMKLANSILGDKLFNLMMKATFYGHFVAGEDQIKIIPCLER